MKVERIDGIVNDYIQSACKEIEQTLIQIDSIPKTVELVKISCIRCNHSWYIKHNRFPIHCANCKSIYWNRLNQKELGFEYFGRRVYAFCGRCNHWLVRNSGPRKRSNGDIVIRLKCGNCGLQSSLNITTNERNVQPKKRRGRKVLDSRIILVDVPRIVAELIRGKNATV